MDDKEKDLEKTEVSEKDALLADDIPLDGNSDFSDDAIASDYLAEDDSNLFSGEEKPAEREEEISAEDRFVEEEKKDEDDDTPVIDESAPVPGAEEMQEALKPRLKETSVKKKKRIIIAVVAAVLVVAITLGIALPIYFVNKDKIFVKTAEDFANYNDGKYFVLDKDVTVNGDLTIERLYNIDLNGHTLTVNGKMTISAGNEGTLYIGTKKGKEYTSKGLLYADTLEILTDYANVNLVSSLNVNTMTVSAKSFTLSSTAQANGTVTVTAENTIDINGAISFGEGEKAKFVAQSKEGCDATVNVNANVTSAVEISDVTLNLAKNATIGSLALDSASRAAVYGKISSSVTTLVPETSEAATLADENADDQPAGNVVALLGTDYSCPEVIGIDTLAMERRNDLSIKVYNCSIVKYIDRLSAPIDVNIDERADGSLVAVASKVQNAQGYSFRVDGGEWVDVAENEYEFTSQLTSQTGTHRIEVYAKGNYSYDNPFTFADDSTLYLSGGTTACEYTYRIQLSTPSGLNVSSSEGVWTLSFNKVPFATGYEYYINGTKYTFRPEGDEAVVSVDISDKMPVAGAYAIRVVAIADSADILTSKAAMTSAIKTEKLATPSLSAVKQEDGTVVLNIGSTPGVSTTYLITYQITVQGGSKESVTLIATDTTVVLDGLNVGDAITVTAQASGYYTQSDPSAAAVTAYVPPVDEGENAQ